MKWTKGQSGNPGGRPKELNDIQHLARQYAASAIEVLAEVARAPRIDHAPTYGLCPDLAR